MPCELPFPSPWSEQSFGTEENDPAESTHDSTRFCHGLEKHVELHQKRIFELKDIASYTSINDVDAC
jgi:hypothetical protein